MAKIIKCKDFGVDCDYEAKGETVEEVLKKADEHVKKNHKIRGYYEDYFQALRKAIRTA